MTGCVADRPRDARGGYAARDLLRACARAGTDDEGRRIVGQYGPPTRQKQSLGRVDPFVLFAVLPTLVIAALFIWGEIAILGVVLILLAALVVLFDAWANRPTGTRAPRTRRNF